MPSSDKCKHGYYTDPMGNNIYPENTAIPIEEAARIYNVTEHETGKTYIVKEEPTNKTIPKQRSTAELIAEAQKIIDRKEPEIVPKPQPKQQPNINEIKRLSRLLQDYRYIK